MFDPARFIEFAETIYRQKKLHTEAGVRTALNRAYVAVLSNAKTKLEGLGKTFPQKEDFYDEILEEIKKKDSKLGDKLEELYGYRFDSDFKFDYEPDKELIPFVVAIAKSFNTRARTNLV